MVSRFICRCQWVRYLSFPAYDTATGSSAVAALRYCTDGMGSGPVECALRGLLVISRQRGSFTCLTTRAGAANDCAVTELTSKSWPILFPEITCNYPGRPENGESFPVADSYSVDEEVNFRCNDGFALVGFTSARCTESKEFSPSLPTCEGNLTLSSSQ